MPRTKTFDDQAVLHKARDLFWERGYNATSIQDLEAHLGISRSSLYRFFGGKRALYDQTLLAYQTENLSRLKQVLSATSDVRKTLTDLFQHTAKQVHPECQSTARGCYIVNATTEMANSCSEALSFVAQNRDQFVAIMRMALARAQQANQLSATAQLDELANFLFLCYNGLQVVVQTQMDRQQLAKTVKLGIDGLPWNKLS